MENKKASSRKAHLPLYGVGPVYGAVIIAVTAAAVIAGHSALFEKGMIKGVKIPSAMIGILLIILGLYLWHGAVFRAKVDDGIVNNKLVTAGVYALVRNPIYSAFMLFSTGALLISGNLFFYPLFFFYWIFMTVLMKCTEEKWLENLYGRESDETQTKQKCGRAGACLWHGNFIRTACGKCKNAGSDGFLVRDDKAGEAKMPFLQPAFLRAGCDGAPLRAGDL